MSDDPSDPELHSCVRWGGYRCQGCVAEGERAATERIADRLVKNYREFTDNAQLARIVRLVKNEENTDD